MWIKICATTNLQDALLAAEAGANAVGFVFAESKRRVTVEEAARITPYLPARIEKIGVFVDTGYDELVKTVEAAQLTGLQIHSIGEARLTARLRQRFGGGFRITQVVHYQQGLEEQLRQAQRDPASDGVVIDSRTPTLLGGTGQRYDWQAARGSLASAASGLRLIVAGGLNPENVGEAIATLHPWGVDVASGVESAPGKKDPEKVRAFVENARIAANRLQTSATVEV